MKTTAITSAFLHHIDACGGAANYLSIDRTYLADNSVISVTFSSVGKESMS